MTTLYGVVCLTKKKHKDELKILRVWIDHASRKTITEDRAEAEAVVELLSRSHPDSKYQILEFEE